MLDELMGKERDVPLGKRQNKALQFDDKDICKYELVALCPNRLFRNTKSDLGKNSRADQHSSNQWDVLDYSPMLPGVLNLQEAVGLRFMTTTWSGQMSRSNGISCHNERKTGRCPAAAADKLSCKLACVSAVAPTGLDVEVIGAGEKLMECCMRTRTLC
jgi:hypothetical protein